MGGYSDTGRPAVSDLGLVEFSTTNLVPYSDLNEAQRAEVHDWVRTHGLEPADIPLDGILGTDPQTGEWRIRVWRRRNGKIYLNGDAPASYIARRRGLAPLPWPTTETTE
jgi:hypothetical protein